MRYLLSALLVAAGVTLPAQQPAGQPPVTFRVEINFVEIDAVVTDAEGNFVRDLTKDDFELIEEGKPQSIASFSLVDLPVRRADPPLARVAPIEPDVQTNAGEFNGRVILIVLDDLQTDFRRSARVKAAASQFVRRFVGANDLVAVLHTGTGAKAGQELTNSQARLLAAIDRFQGQKLPSPTLVKLDDYFKKYRQGSDRPAADTLDAERAHKARSSLSTLRAASQYLESIRGRRKALVWFGEGIDYETVNLFEGNFATLIREDMRDTIAVTSRAGVSLYGVDVRTLGAGLDTIMDIPGLPNAGTPEIGPNAVFAEVRRAQDFLRTMSTETGGFAIVNENDLDGAFARIIQANSSYYLLGYYPANNRRDGKFRRVEVKMKRPGLQVKARAGYTEPKGRAPAITSAAAKTEASPDVRAALDSPVPANGLELRVFAAPFSGPGGKSAVAVVVELAPGGLSFVEKDGVFSEEVEVVMLPVNASGKPLPGTRDVAPMRLSKRTYDVVRANGFRIARRFDLEPGRYQLRTAARSANARAVGAVTYDLDVPDFTKAPLAISGLSLTSTDGARVPTPQAEKAFLDVVPDVPTTLREFRAGDTLALFAEVYDNRASTPHRVAISTTVTGDDGRVAFNTSEERQSEEIQAKSGGFVQSLKIPLAGFAPGRYVLRMEARIMLADGAVASREVEFRVR